MSKDLECPYCGNWNEVNHDDGYGYEEDRLHEQDCDSCGKTFTYTTSVHFYYESYKNVLIVKKQEDQQKKSGKLF